jgi:hypothetical protein
MKPDFKGDTVLDFLKRRLPARSDIVLVASTAVFLVFSWSLRSIFFQYPSYILSYTVWEIFAIVAYHMAFALLESALVVAVFVTVAFLLPGKWFKEGFAWKASLGIITLAALSIYLQAVMNNQPKINWLAMQLGRGVLAWLAAMLVTHFVPFVRKILLDILDRLTVFLYLYLPIGLVSLLVVIVRLVW